MHSEWYVGRAQMEIVLIRRGLSRNRAITLEGIFSAPAEIAAELEMSVFKPSGDIKKRCIVDVILLTAFGQPQCKDLASAQFQDILQTRPVRPVRYHRVI